MYIAAFGFCCIRSVFSSQNSTLVRLFNRNDFSQRSKQEFLWYSSFWVSLSNVYMYQVTSKVDSQWVHLVLNFMRPEERFQVFKDGTLVPGQQTKKYFSRPLGNGRLVLGKRFPHRDNFYSSIEVDELVFFNRKFTEPEVIKLYNNYNWFLFPCNMWCLSLTNFATVNSLKRLREMWSMENLLKIPLIMMFSISPRHNWFSDNTHHPSTTNTGKRTIHNIFHHLASVTQVWIFLSEIFEKY